MLIRIALRWRRRLHLVMGHPAAGSRANRVHKAVVTAIKCLKGTITMHGTTIGI